MKNDDLLRKIKQETERLIPDGLHDVLRRAEASDAAQYEKGLIIDMTSINKIARKKSALGKWVKSVSAVAAAAVVAFGVWLGTGYYRVDSVIGLDVNPSIELNVNKADTVLQVRALNDEANTVLGDMNLKNVDLNVAVNALVGSMLKHGYVNEARNSVLISVENTNQEKGVALQQRLMTEVSNLLSTSSVGGAVVSQTIEDDQRLKTLANQNSISLGKAALVDLLVSQDTRLNFADIAALSINDINLLIANRQDSLQTVALAGTASSGTYIGEDRAKAIALGDAGIAATDAQIIRLHLDYDDGRMVYEVDFYTSTGEYEYEIDAVGGQIVGSDIDLYTTATGDPANYIGEERAKEIALKHAGLTASQVTFIRVRLDRDDGRDVYDIEFFSGSIEYDYEIDATNSQILEYDQDVENFAVPSLPSVAPGTAASVNYIGEERAKEIALKHAGLTASGVTFIRAHLDRDDGRNVYDVEFYKGNTEYDYEIDAIDGTIREYDRDVENYAPPASSSAQHIGAVRAKEIALKDAGLTESQVTFIRAVLGRDDGRSIYDVEFYKDNVEYDYEIDAVSGTVLESDMDIENYTAGSSSSAAQSADFIGEARAKQIALGHAGLTEAQVTFIRAHLDRDDGRNVYDVEFYNGNTEYDYEIDAIDGTIREYDREVENYTPPQSSPSNTASNASYIGDAKAKEIALQQAGLAASAVTRMKCELDRDDGRYVYEVEFRQGRVEYEFEIDPISGTILEWDSDYDD